jgi:cob(I)alamin adenosyltransferase
VKPKLRVRIDRVYTKRGDAGETDLVGGAPTSKASLRIESFGAVDEANAAIGVARDACRARRKPAAASRRIDAMLRRVQNELFNVGSELATPPAKLHPGQPVVEARHVEALEREMDALNEDLEPLRSFVLPGGGPVGAALHVARTICRRAERAVVRLATEEPVRAETLRYLNRLSDHLFVLGRWAAKQYGEPEPLWEPEKT